MSDSARVTAIDALNELRVALVCFSEEASEAVLAADTEIRRIDDFLEEQLTYWTHEVRRSEDQVFQAETELTRRKMLAFDQRVVDTTDQELALRRALARLEYAEEQVKISKRWARQWPQALIDYQGPAGQIKGMLEGELPRACAFLERKTEALQAYATTTAPLVPNKSPEEGPTS